MKHISTVLVCLLLSMTACQHSGIYRQLVRVDSLLHENRADSALRMLRGIDPSNLSEEERAYFDLLSTQTMHRLFIPIASDSAIQNSIIYFQRQGDKPKLARAYYCHAMILDKQERDEEAIIELKRAEEAAQGLNDPFINETLMSGLALLNLQADNLLLASRYAHKAVKEAQAAGDGRLLCSDYQTLATIFSRMDMPDSSHYYQTKTIPLVRFLDEKERTAVYTSIAVDCLNRGQTDSAKHYLRQSLAISHTPHACYLMSELLIDEGETEEAERLWQEALSVKDARIKAEMLDVLARWYEKHGQHEQSAATLRRLVTLQDSLKRSSHSEVIKQLQTDFDQDRLRFQAHHIIGMLAAVILLLALLMLGYGWWNRRHRMRLVRQLRRQEQRIGQQAEEVKTVQQQLEQARRQQEESLQEQERIRKEQEHAVRMMERRHSREKEKLAAKSQRELERRMERIRRQHAEAVGEREAMLERGHRLFDALAEGQTTVKWKRLQMQECVEYYRTIDRDFVEQMRHDYEELTPGQELLMVLRHLGRSDESLRTTLCLSPSGLRAQLSRIAHKRLPS